MANIQEIINQAREMKNYAQEYTNYFDSLDPIIKDIRKRQKLKKDISKTLEFANQHFRIIEEIKKEIDDYERMASQVQAEFESLDPIDLNLTSIKELYHEIKEFKISYKLSIIMIELEWPPLVYSSKKLRLSILKVYEDQKISVDETKKIISEYILDYYSNKLLNKMIANWHDNELLDNRIHILEAAVNAHIEGKYQLSIPTILPQIEGLIAEGFSHKDYMGGKKLKEYYEKLLSEEETEPFDKIMKEFLFEIVLAKFKHGHDINSFLSRHAILHGGDFDYAYESNSLKAILMFDYLQNIINWRLKRD